MPLLTSLVLFMFTISDNTFHVHDIGLHYLKRIEYPSTALSL